MTEDTYSSLRRQFLSLGLTGAVVGTAGCTGMLNVEDQSESENGDDGTPSADIDAANFTFEYDSESQSVEIIFNGGAGIVASNLQVRHESGKEVIWAELGSTTAGPEEEISTGTTALLGPNVLNWELPIAEDDMVRLVYVGKETPATLERYSPPESTDSETTVPASISSFSVESNSEQQLQISFIASQQLSTIQVDISGPETTTLSESEFTESQSGDDSYSYEATYEASSDGEFTATLEEAVDVNGNSGTNSQTISDTTTTSSEDTTPPSIAAFSIANPSEKNLRTSFDSDEQLSTIQVSISGPESVILTRNEFSETATGDGTYSYEATYEADSSGEYNATLTEATDSADNDGATGAEVSITISEEISATPEFRLDDSLPSSFDNNGVDRQATDSAVGDYAWSFDGESHITTDYVWEEVDQSGTLCAWVYIPSAETNNESSRHILSSHDGGSYSDFNGEILGLSQWANGDGIGLFRRTQNDSIRVRATDFPTDEWFHLATVIEAQQEVRTYINGQLRDSASDIEFDDMEQEPVFAIGAQYRQRGSSHDIRGKFVGQLDDVQIFEDALSVEEINVLVNRK